MRRLNNFPNVELLKAIRYFCCGIVERSRIFGCCN